MSAAPDILIRELAARGVRLSRRGDKLHVKAPRAVVTDELRRVLAANKPRLMAALVQIQQSPPRAIVHFRLAGNSENAWASCLGAPGESIDFILRDLRERHGDRLLECRSQYRASRTQETP